MSEISSECQSAPTGAQNSNPEEQADRPLGDAACSLSSIYCSGKPTFSSIPPGWIEVQCKYSPPRFIRGRDIKKLKFTDDLRLLEVHYGGSTPIVIDFPESPSCRQSIWRVLDEYGIALQEAERRRSPRVWTATIQQVFGSLRHLLARKRKLGAPLDHPKSDDQQKPLPYPLIRHVGSSI